MRRNLDEELEIVKIRYKQREMELEKLRKQILQERKQGEQDYKKRLEELERIERESKERMAKYRAEQEKINKDVDFYLVNTLIILVIAALASVLGPVLVGLTIL